MSPLQKILDTKPAHVIRAEQMADAIYSENNDHHIEMLEVISQRLIKHNQVMLEKLRKFNK